MAISEYYIRQPDSEEARGPYDLGRIGDLIEAGKADVTTLYFDEDREDWLPLVDNPDFREVLFPEKQRLGLRAKEITETLNDEDDDVGAVTVDDMLAAADGQTEETKEHRSKEDVQARAANLGMWALAGCFIISVIANLHPGAAELMANINEGNYLALMSNPLVVLSAVDAFIALCCILAATELYPAVRFRIALGLGFFAYTYWVWDATQALSAYAIASLGMFLLTLTISFPVVLLASVMGLGGMGYIVYLQLF